MWLPLAVLVHIFYLTCSVGIQNHLFRAGHSQGKADQAISETSPAHHERVVVNDHGAAKLMRTTASAKSQSNISSSKMFKESRSTHRRGVMRPSISLEIADAHHTDLRMRLVAAQIVDAEDKPKQFKKRKVETAETWRFRGPKPFALLGDLRYTHGQKEKELERLMEKLHLEFFKKKEMGHSQLAQARSMFYRAVGDYSKLTGRDHPPEFLFEELPEVPAGSSSEDEEEKDNDAKDDPCAMLRVNGTDTIDKPLGVGVEATSGGSNVLDEELAEESAPFVLAPLLEANLLSFRATPTPASSIPVHAELIQQDPDSDDYEDTAGARRQQGVPDTADRAAIVGSRRRRTKPQDGTTNAPLLCAVSHPEMLGDGNCDGGLYNTAECNYDGGDCCEAECRPAKHECGTSGYQCLGARIAAKVGYSFKCSRDKLIQFSDYLNLLRDELTMGRSMFSARCTQLKEEEHNNYAQAFNLGIELQYNAAVRSAAAEVSGPIFFMDCTLWDTEIGSDWFGALVSHEMGHTAGYSHPSFKLDYIQFDSECENIGADLCPGHCKLASSACQNHMMHGSQFCGFAGCKTTCVHADYCFSMPERAPECFGFEKVHSRGDTMYELEANTLRLTAQGLGWSGACQPLVALPFMLAAAAVLPVIGGAGPFF